MANGTTKDLKNVLVVIDNIVIPQQLMLEPPSITLPQNRTEVVGGGNAGGFEHKKNNSVDGMFTLRLFKRDEAFTIEQKYLTDVNISIYVKDNNTSQTYAEPSTYITNVSEYSIGDSGAIEFEIAMPTMLRQ